MHNNLGYLHTNYFDVRVQIRPRPYSAASTSSILNDERHLRMDEEEEHNIQDIMLDPPRVGRVMREETSCFER